MEQIAIEQLKAYGIDQLLNAPSLTDLISQWAADKEFSPQLIRSLAITETFGRVMSKYIMALPDDPNRIILNYMGKRVIQQVKRKYKGTRTQNKAIDGALARSKYIVGSSRSYGVGMSVSFNPEVVSIPSDLKTTPIAVIGSGAAGMLVTNSLRSLGMNKVRLFEKTDKVTGLWARDNVNSGSRNNPRSLAFRSHILDAAPGDGKHVKAFLDALQPTVDANVNVKAVEPDHNFKHKVFITSGPDPWEFPIVINCSGIGVPRAANDPDRMHTSLGLTELGERWQRRLDPAKAAKQHFTLVGLGNSTAEMLRQIHTLQDQGVDCDYTILTHYNKNVLNNPDSTVEQVINGGHKLFRVFRDVTVPDLVSYQGDLPLSRYDYFRALHSNRIMYARRWTKQDNKIGFSDNSLSVYPFEFKTDSLFTLIGYSPSPQTLKEFGMPGCNVDYDGEVQTGSSIGNRVYHGYFAFGSITANEDRQNDMVIPGMLFRLPDLLSSVIFRVAEYVKGKE